MIDNNVLDLIYDLENLLTDPVYFILGEAFDRMRREIDMKAEHALLRNKRNQELIQKDRRAMLNKVDELYQEMEKFLSRQDN